MTLESPYITHCPVGCTAPLEITTILLAEGALRRCSGCGQLLSSANEAQYLKAMVVFNAPDFNQPHAHEVERRRRVAQRRLKTVQRLLNKAPAELRVLDIGCSRGAFVQAAALEGYVAEGVEPAPEIAAAARAQDINVRTGLLEEQGYTDAHFDVASLFEVVEHLREPLPLLRECRRILKPGGILLLSTGNTHSWTAAAMGARWDYFHMASIGGHISFFNPRSIATIAGNTGFSVERIETARVKFHEKADISKFTYVAGKLAAEALNVPARWADRGHDMLAYLRRY